ncbi:hypothetical protein HK413_05220 [Mucilaginibacter sp. S1162]|uniref:Uncharacterized protein n=1 Tax=Mucilaginibacter humi TaxID=2732510 RepID=A0ABX1W210_9SPHI|nr:hypothetical protein [Mucilaginibacter humi]NNU33696.1 hypothetical protein [Mucilaginibacter humi]
MRREVLAAGMTPLSIYYGPYTNSTTDLLNWKTFPYKQTDNTISFSNVLFTALGLPETRSDESTINMHQILRLLYIDQDTPTQNLFRLERFDLPLTRQTISEVLLGIYDDDLYNKRLALKLANKDYETKSREFDHLNRIFSLKTNSSSDLTSLQQEIEQTTFDLAGIDEKIIDLKSKVTVNVSKKSATELELIQSELTREKSAVSEISSSIQEYEVEILDSEQFINTINKRVVELTHSTLTRKVLGELPLTHCPHCLSKLDPVDKEHICILCKKPLNEEVEKANAKRLQQELEIRKGI